jgi:hypothetical protein
MIQKREAQSAEVPLTKIAARHKEGISMPYVTVGKENSGNIEIYYKDWGSGQPRSL